MKYLLPFFVFLFLIAAPARSRQANPQLRFEWHKVAELPSPAGATQQPGLAGAFAGIHNGVLIVAGGANFPDAPPWEGGLKVFHDEIWAYHTITRTWTRLDTMPTGSQVTTTAAVKWGDRVLIPSGETAPGVRTPDIFAASMSSLYSSMNSVAAVLTTDFARRLRPQSEEKSYLRMARWITVLIGLVGTFLALMMVTWGISSLWDQFNMIVGLFTGGLGGIFLLGIFSRRTNGAGAIAGLLLSAALQYVIKKYTEVHLLLYSFTGMATAIVTGYTVSLFTGHNRPEAEAYTLAGLQGNGRLTKQKNKKVWND